MRVIGLDLSTKSGWAVLDDKRLVDYGLVQVVVASVPLEYPMNLCLTSQLIADDLIKIIKKFWVTGTEIVVEDTNLGASSQRYAQKILEFIHCSVLSRLLAEKLKPIYLNSHDWRSAVKLYFNDSQKNHNQSLIDAKEQQRQALLSRIKEMMNHKYNPLILKANSRAHARELESKKKKESKDLQKYFLSSLKAPVGRVTHKNLSVDKVNELYGTKFSISDNDICDAILIARARFERVQL